MHKVQKEDSVRIRLAWVALWRSMIEASQKKFFCTQLIQVLVKNTACRV